METPVSIFSTETPDFLKFLGDLMKKYKSPELQELPPFRGGLVGYPGYETAGFIEDVPVLAQGDNEIPDAVLVVSDTVIV